MKKLTVLTITPAALVMASSVVVAAPPAGFSYDDYTVSAGTITASCPVGYTCTNLDATGNGILQQLVTDGTDSYFRTIVVEEGITAGDLAAVQDQGFRNESYVGANDSTVGYVRAFGVVQGEGPNQVATYTDTSAGTGTLGVTSALTDSFYTMAEIRGVGEVDIEQVNVLDQANQTSTTGTPDAAVITRGMNFAFSESGGDTTLRLDAVQPANEGQITIRSATAGAAGSLALTDGDPGLPTVAYSAGDQLQVVWLEQAASGTGSQFDRVLGQQSYTNLDTGESVVYNNADGAGNFVAVNTGAGNPVDGIGPWNWDAGLFGTEPVPYLVNGDGTGTALPTPAMATFPD